MPKFVYTVILIILLLTSTNIYVMSKLDPYLFYSKTIFVLLFLLTLNLIISLTVTLISFFRKEKLELRSVFKNTFRNSLGFSIICSILLLLKLFKLLSFSTFLILAFATYLLPIGLKKVKKSRKRRIY